VLKEQNIKAFFANTSCAAGAMHETVNVTASTLDYYINIIYVEATSSHICCNKDLLRILLSVFIKPGLSLALLKISMQSEEIGVS